MSENSIEFSLLNSEQRDSWLNSGHRTLDADTMVGSTQPRDKLGNQRNQDDKMPAPMW